MPARLHVDAALAPAAELSLPPEAARHVQVLRLQPGDPLILFNGLGGEWNATVTAMGRQTVDVRVESHLASQRELPRQVTLAVGMPANERMDALIEKATELGAHAIQPLQCARSVLKLSGERADKRRAHWQGVAVAAAEQSGRTAVTQIEPILSLSQWLSRWPAAAAVTGGVPARCHVLSFGADAVAARSLLSPAEGSAQGPADTTPVVLLSGPEGGLDAQEEALARSLGFVPLSLGPRVLRADTAPLAALALLGA
jgi:16S rRNA (uracil1498-N3)-methyltransferase